MCAGYEPMNRTQRKPALGRIINPRQTAGPAYGKHATSRWSAESAANTPAAHGNTPIERRACRTYVRWARGPWVT